MNEVLEIPVYSFPQADDLNHPFRVIALDAPPTYVSNKPHRHNYFEIFLFTKGTGIHLIDFVEHTISMGSVHFVFPGQVHRIKRSKDSRGIVLLFTAEFIYMDAEGIMLSEELNIINELSENPVIRTNEDCWGELTALTQLLKSETTRSENYSEGIARSLIRTFLLKCRQFQSNQVQNPEPKTGGTVQKHVQTFRQLLAARYREWHYPAEYAEAMGLTEKHLNEVIKIHFGQPVGKLIRERLILEAKRLLYNTDMSAKEIAYYLDFSDPAYFNRFFKSATAMTTQEFRQVMRKKYSN